MSTDELHKDEKLRKLIQQSFHPAFLKCQALMDAKSHDYNKGKIQDAARIDYHPYGHTSYMHMLHVKKKRLESLMALRESGAGPKYESLKDSIEDLINYAAFYWSYVDTEEQTRETERRQKTNAS